MLSKSPHPDFFRVRKPRQVSRVTPPSERLSRVTNMTKPEWVGVRRVCPECVMCCGTRKTGLGLQRCHFQAMQLASSKTPLLSELHVLGDTSILL